MLNPFILRELHSAEVRVRAGSSLHLPSASLSTGESARTTVTRNKTSQATKSTWGTPDPAEITMLLLLEPEIQFYLIQYLYKDCLYIALK